MKRALVVLLFISLAGCSRAPSPDAEIAAARAVFMRNIEAIQRKDHDGYLACYRSDEALVRNGPAGPKQGFAELAAGTSTSADGWPESLEASDVELHWLGPGIVYGSYRYRVVFDGVASVGISERVFARRGERWEIVVTTAFGGAVSSDAALADVAFLAGTWLESKDGRWTEETWSLARGGTMMGSGRTIVDGKTRAWESLRIEAMDGGIELIATPHDQPPARFRLTEPAPDRAVFENPAHDFPKRISYRLEGERLTARIEGDGRSVEWVYARQ